MTDKFWQDWRDNTAIAVLCERLFCYLSDHENRLDHFSFDQLAAVSRPQNVQELAQALQYLSSPKWEIFRQVFFFFDGEDVHEFSNEEMAEIYEAHAFVHPRSDVIITDLDMISVAFEPGVFFEHEGAHRT